MKWSVDQAVGSRYLMQSKNVTSAEDIDRSKNSQISHIR